MAAHFIFESKLLYRYESITRSIPLLTEERIMTARLTCQLNVFTFCIFRLPMLALTLYKSYPFCHTTLLHILHILLAAKDGSRLTGHLWA